VYHRLHLLLAIIIHKVGFAVPRPRYLFAIAGAYCLCLVLTCHDAAGYHSNEWHGPTAESARIVRLLTDKCNALALRLQQVEQELSAAHKSGLIPVPTTAAATDNDDVS
jgi:hypothetical protein